ncbi:MAG TPA: ABC transporter permease [Anaerolineae bacterium]|nr:ABC transporter permease [Anaerolineae bacterium]
MAEAARSPAGAEQRAPGRAQRGSWLRKLSTYGLTLAAILTINFFLPRAMPGDPLLALIDPESQSFALDPALRAELERYYGLDRPVWEQYLAYVANLLRGELGRSIALNVPVAELIGSHLPWTLLLMGSAIVLSNAISLFLGVHSAWVRNSVVDRSLLAVFLLLNTLPVFLFGALLLMLFAVQLDWLPLGGGRTPFATLGSGLQELGDRLSHLALPLATLTLGMAGRNFLIARNSTISILGQDFMLVARGMGLPVRSQKYRHAMRNALLPVITRFSLQMGTAVTGAVLIETLFAYPGMGRLMFNAVGARDYPVLEGCFLVAGLVTLLANLATDVSYAWLDPRTRRQP